MREVSNEGFDTPLPHFPIFALSQFLILIFPYSHITFARPHERRTDPSFPGTVSRQFHVAYIPSCNSRDADEDGECDILLDHGLRGGSLILLNLLRETGNSWEDEQSGDCEISDGLVQQPTKTVTFPLKTSRPTGT